ncbi:hypothetical protein C7C45_32630 [Micromonospora arborensis]|uniref:Uncharacterized protein n=1 Tax=Micromonospora arborensis TaxID=2116518 RepID=A0A318N9Y2_9ACTN|nr:hypothetical protein [Micromonospora arborensis]PYC62835.1 hypothetical protein C7C45_32630 [Micromonospora arborensis]
MLDKRMLALLLGRQDLDGDWEILGRGDLPREPKTSDPACTRVKRDLYSAENASLQGSLRWRQAGPGNGRGFLQVVKLHPGQGAAAEVARVRASVERCRSWGEGEGLEAGYLHNLSMQLATAPRVGDEAVAWRYTSRIGPAAPPFRAYSVLFRVGSVTSLIDYSAGAKTSDATAEKELHKLVALAAARVAEAI